MIILDPNNTNTTNQGVNPLTGEPTAAQGSVTSVDPTMATVPAEPAVSSEPTTTAEIPTLVENPVVSTVTPPVSQPMPTTPVAEPMGTPLTEPTTTDSNPVGVPPVQQS